MFYYLNFYADGMPGSFIDIFAFLFTILTIFGKNTYQLIVWICRLDKVHTAPCIEHVMLKLGGSLP